MCCVSWMVNSAVSFYVSPRRDFFASYKPGDYGVVRMDKKDTSSIIDVSIHVKISLGYKLVLKDLRHVPDLSLN